MKIVIVGSGAREDVLRRAHEQSPEVDEIIAVPGNGMMDFSRMKTVKRYPEVKATDIPSIVGIAQQEKVDLVDIGPEGPLAAGLVDELFKAGIPAFGPKLSATFLEADKAEARDFMNRHAIPQPQYMVFTSEESGLSYVSSLPPDLFPKYVKAAGLCGGKGALKAVNIAEAQIRIKQMKDFEKSGERYLVEDCMAGEEVSIFAFCDGKTYKLVRKAAQDNKRALNYDEGEQTGGMGGHAPAMVATTEHMDKFGEIARNTIKGMKEEGIPYAGVLYLGGMITPEGPKIVEYNMRHGDPEAQITIPGLVIRKKGTLQTASYTMLVQSCTQGELDKFDVETDGNVRVCIVGSSRGYPGDYSAMKKKRIYGIEDAMCVPGVTVYGGGVECEDGKLYVDGGRLFSVVAEGRNVIDARAKAYCAISMVHIDGNNLHFRDDIAWRDVQRLRA